MQLALRAWLQAARLPSQLYLWLPLFWGQAYVYATEGRYDPLIAWVVLFYGLCHQLFIVFANDVADQAADRCHTSPTLFSGGSRVLVEGRLSERALWRAALGAGCLCILLSIGLAHYTQHWDLVAASLLGLALLWAYSFPPLRLSYRGGGELLQALGLGLVLPYIGISAQGGAQGLPWAGLVVLVPTQLACALTTSLPDVDADRQSSKRTFAVSYGPRCTHYVIALLNITSIALYSAGMWLEGTPVAPPPVLLSLLPLSFNLMFLALGVPPTASRRLILKAACALAVSLCLLTLMIAGFTCQR